MGSLEVLVHDLRTFANKKEVAKVLRAEIREPVPKVRKAIKARALATMPARGGLNTWLSQSTVTASVRLSGRSAGVRLRVGRNSQGGRSDIQAIDRGRLRAPSWGRRGPGAWHNQAVPPGFASKPSTEVDQWREACLRAVDRALDVIRRG